MNKIRKIAVVFLLGIFTIIYAGTSFSEITFNGAFKRNQMDIIA